MEPAAGPGRSGVCPEGGTDPGQASSAPGRAPGAQGSWSGAAGGNWITAHPTVGPGGGPLGSRGSLGLSGSRSPARVPQDSPPRSSRGALGSPRRVLRGDADIIYSIVCVEGGSGPWGSGGMPLPAGAEVYKAWNPCWET